VVGSVASYASDVDYFILYVTDCTTSVITTSAISSPYNYIMNVGALETIATLSWTSSLSQCPSLTYVL
jgi:hypothetical protein